MKKIAVLFIAIIISGLGYFLYKKQEKQSMDIQLIPREVLFGNPERAQVRLSSDGKYLSYLANLDGVLNIFVAKVHRMNVVLLPKIQAEGFGSISGYMIINTLLILKMMVVMRTGVFI